MIPSNPFVGLRPFESSDSLFYFGRNKVLPIVQTKIPEK